MTTERHGFEFFTLQNLKTWSSVFNAEVVAQKRSLKEVFLKILQSSKEIIRGGSKTAATSEMERFVIIASSR